VLPAAARLLDRVVIRLARRHLQGLSDSEGRLEEARSILEAEDFFGDRLFPAANMHFTGGKEFVCDSPYEGVSSTCRRIYGRFYSAGDDRPHRPAVILLHGWNGEMCYRLLFPLLARKFLNSGISTLMFELPCHGARRASSGTGSDFLSADLAAVAESARQAVADTRALIGWLRQRGHGPLGIWGISLGAWIAGLIACRDQRLAAAVLMAPLSRIDLAIAELDFCAPLRQSLGGRGLPFARINLPSHRPLLEPAEISLIAGHYDQFVPSRHIDELSAAWNHPNRRYFRHGHISMLFCRRAMTESTAFLRRSLDGNGRNESRANHRSPRPADQRRS